MFWKNKLNLIVKNLQNQKFQKSVLSSKVKRTRVLFDKLTDDESSKSAGLIITIKKNPSTKGGRISGAKDRARTGHPDLGKVVLYQMSYFRMVVVRFLIKQWKNLSTLFRLGTQK